MPNPSNNEIKKAVRERYAQIAIADSPSGKGQGSCCSKDKSAGASCSSETLGYSAAELAGAPKGADLGLGCGNPQAIAALKPGETVLDLGSGAGIDCFLAARQVGPTGRVIGVDMTPEMLAKARENAAAGNFQNTEFRLGEIEHLPVADASVDVVISNCVINLSPDKAQVLREAFRVLKSGGRVAISDVVATADLPDDVKRDLALYAGCMAGAIPVSEYKALLEAAGFIDVSIEPKDASKKFIREWAPGRRVDEFIASASIQARKP